MNKKLSIVASLLAVTVVSSTLAYATTIATSKVTACANKSTGILRVAKTCAKNENSVPLISGSVQLAPAYYDAAGKPVNTIWAGFNSKGQVDNMQALVNGKVVTVNGITGLVTPIGDIGVGYGAYINNDWDNPITYTTADCSDVPFLWLPNNPNGYMSQTVDLFKTLTTNPNYPGYFTLTYGSDAPLYYSISPSAVGYVTGMSIYHKRQFTNECVEDMGGDGGAARHYTPTGYTTKGLTVYTGTKLPNFRGPITVRVQ